MSYVIVFRSRLQPGITEQYSRRAEEIYRRAIEMPGFIASKDFTADDGERVALIEFDSEEHLLAWRDHLEHRRAQAEGRESFYASYSLQICKVERSSTFDRATGAWTQQPTRW